MDYPTHFGSYIMPGFEAYFIVHLVLFNPFLLPNWDRKGARNPSMSRRAKHYCNMMGTA